MTRRKRMNRVAAARRLVALLALLPAGASLFLEAPVPAGTRALVTLLWMLSLVPAYAYFAAPAGARRPLPFLPAVSFMYGLYYALPLTLGVTDQYYNAPVDSLADYDYPVQLAFFGWIAMMGAYFLVGLFIRERPPRHKIIWRPGIIAFWGFALLYGAMLVFAIRAYFGSAIVSGGAQQFIISLQWLGAGLLTILARRGEASRTMKLFALVGIIFAAAMMLAGGSIAPVAMLFGIVGFGLWIGRPSIQAGWIIAAVIVFLAAVSFRGVAIDFRKTAWFGTQQLTQNQRFGLMLQLLKARVETNGPVETVAHGLAATAGRSANLDLFANVVRRTPSEVPHWNGATYKSLVGSFIPRFLWPDKPTKELGQAFGHRYSYIYWTNTSTAINLPILVEFYANFSITGVILGMMIVGLIYRVLDAAANRRGQTPLVSMIGAVLLLPLLLIESDFSLTFGGLPLNAASLAFVWFMINRAPVPEAFGDMPQSQRPHFGVGADARLLGAAPQRIAAPRA